MRTRPLVVGVAAAGLFLTVIALAGCCPLLPPGKSGEVWVREDRDGREAAVRVGQVLVVDLEAAPTTGYRWEVAIIDAAILRQPIEPEFESKAPLLGAPAQQRMRFAVVGAGRCTLTLVYRRPWETGREPAKTYTVRVTASAR